MESRYRTLVKRPYHRIHHAPGPAKDGFCTVTGVPPWHRAKWSIDVQSAKEQVTLASCDEHLPPMAEEA